MARFCSLSYLLSSVKNYALVWSRSSSWPPTAIYISEQSFEIGPSVSPIQSLDLGSLSITPVDKVKNLGFIFDHQMNLDSQNPDQCSFSENPEQCCQIYFQSLWKEDAGTYNAIYLKKLHFLPVRYRIKFKIALLVFKCLNNLAPQRIATFEGHSEACFQITG